MTDVTVIGGGLAGMAAALRLAERGCAVTLYEKSDRLGGKAGANQAFGEHDDHGFHIFPPWYLNIWQLVDELKIRDNFVDLHDFVQLSGNDYRTRNVDQFKTLHDAAAFKNVWRNLMSSPLPFHQTLLFFFSTIDLATHRFNQRAKLDQISITGFLRTRFYRTEQIAEVYQDLMLKAISVPSYFVSAMTTRHVIRYWKKHPLPMHRILRGNLQQFFIEPFRARLDELGVRVVTRHRLERLTCERRRIVAAEFLDFASGEQRTVPVDRIVLAVPADSVSTFATSELYTMCTTLGNLRNLRSRPMAALNIYFTETIPNLPVSHVNLIGSKYGLTFIDVSKTWSGLDGSALNVIATDFSELEGVDNEDAANIIVDELRRFIPTIDPTKIRRREMLKHVEEPLFMNDVGIWHFRPNAVPINERNEVEVENLYLAGDYCQSHVDLVSMEGAFTTGLHAAEAVRRDTPALAKTSSVQIRIPEDISPLWWFVWLAGLPIAGVAKAIALLRGDR